MTQNSANQYCVCGICRWFNGKLLVAILLMMALAHNWGTSFLQAQIIINERNSIGRFDVWASPPLDRHHVVMETMELTKAFEMSEEHFPIVQDAMASGIYSTETTINSLPDRLAIAGNVSMVGEAEWINDARSAASIYDYFLIHFSVVGDPVEFTITGNLVATGSNLIRLRNGTDIFRFDSTESFDDSGTLPPGDYTFLVTMSALDSDNGPGFSGSMNYEFVVGIAPQFVPADSFNMYRGILVSGGITDCEISDDSRMTFNPGLTLNPSEAPVWVEFQGNLGANNVPHNLVVESHASTPGLTYTVDMWNWVTAQYDVIGIGVETFSVDSTESFDISTVNHIGPSGEVEARIGWRETGLTIGFPWESRLDLIGWDPQ